MVAAVPKYRGGAVFAVATPLATTACNAARAMVPMQRRDAQVVRGRLVGGNPVIKQNPSESDGSNLELPAAGALRWITSVSQRARTPHQLPESQHTAARLAALHGGGQVGVVRQQAQRSLFLPSLCPCPPAPRVPEASQVDTVVSTDASEIVTTTYSPVHALYQNSASFATMQTVTRRRPTRLNQFVPFYRRKHGKEICFYRSPHVHQTICSKRRAIRRRDGPSWLAV